MASYYPEGECYFVRRSLRLPSHYNAEDRRNFYSHALVEYYWNGWVSIGIQSRPHRRSVLRHGTPTPLFNNTRYGDWDRFWVGESRERDPTLMTEMHSYHNSLNWNECRDLDNGGPRKYILRPVSIRRNDTQWLWIDATIPIRAIYFPVAQETDQAFQNLCTYVVIDLRHRERVTLTRYDNNSTVTNIPVTIQGGLGRRDDMTWGFHVPDIIAYLTIPHKLRNPDYRLFQSKNRRDDLVVYAPSSLGWGSPPSFVPQPQFFRQIDFAEVLSATFGVEVGWRPFEPSNFLRNLIVDLVNLGLGFIPGVGPLLTVAFGIAVQLLEDPESFRIENILDLNQAAMDNVTRSAPRQKKYLAPGFMGKGRGRQAPVTLSDDERASRKKYGEELNEKLTKELKPQLVIRSLLEQDLLLHGADSINGVVEEEQAELETIQMDDSEDNMELEGEDEGKKED